MWNKGYTLVTLNFYLPTKTPALINAYQSLWKLDTSPNDRLSFWRPADWPSPAAFTIFLIRPCWYYKIVIMNPHHYLAIIFLSITIITTTSALEIRVLTGLNMKGGVNQPDFTDQKLVINSNNRYIYPSQQVPEYNVYHL